MDGLRMGRQDAPRKKYRITLSREAAFYADFLIDEESLRSLSALCERLIMQAVKRRKVEDRPVYDERSIE